MHAHKAKIGSEVKDNLNDFAKLANDLGCYKNGLQYYNAEGETSAEDLVKSVLLKRFSFKNREQFTAFLKNKELLNEAQRYFPEINKWSNKQDEDW